MASRGREWTAGRHAPTMMLLYLGNAAFMDIGLMDFGPFSSIASLSLMPIFWLVTAVLFLGLELLNRRVIYFLPGSVAAAIIAVLMVLYPVMPAYLPSPPTAPGTLLILWLVLTCGGMGLFAILRPRIRRRQRRRSRRRLFIN